MKLLIIAIAALGLGASAAAAQETTYTFTGGLYTSINNATNCTVGDCATYTTSQRPVITLTFAAPLAPNLPRADRSAQVIAYTLNDGVRTTNGPGPNAAIFGVFFRTNSAGLPSAYDLVLMRTPGPPYPVDSPSDPNSRFSFVSINPASANAVGNVVCPRRGSGAGSVSGPGVCNGEEFDGGSSVAESNQATLVTRVATTPPAPIPTMTEWAMIFLAVLLAGGAAVHLTRRRVA